MKMRKMIFSSSFFFFFIIIQSRWTLSVSPFQLKHWCLQHPLVETRKQMQYSKWNVKLETAIWKAIFLVSGKKSKKLNNLKMKRESWITDKHEIYQIVQFTNVFLIVIQTIPMLREMLKIESCQSLSVLLLLKLEMNL